MAFLKRPQGQTSEVNNQKKKTKGVILQVSTLCDHDIILTAVGRYI